MGNGGCPAHQDKIIEKLEKVEKNLGGKIEDINERLLDPDEGLYARVGRNTAFRKTAKRWLTIISITSISAGAKAAYDFIKVRL